MESSRTEERTRGQAPATEHKHTHIHGRCSSPSCKPAFVFARHMAPTRGRSHHRRSVGEWVRQHYGGGVQRTAFHLAGSTGTDSGGGWANTTAPTGPLRTVITIVCA